MNLQSEKSGNTLTHDTLAHCKKNRGSVLIITKKVKKDCLSLRVGPSECGRRGGVGEGMGAHAKVH